MFSLDLAEENSPRRKEQQYLVTDVLQIFLEPRSRTRKG